MDISMDIYWIYTGYIMDIYWIYNGYINMYIKDIYQRYISNMYIKYVYQRCISKMYIKDVYQIDSIFF